MLAARIHFGDRLLAEGARPTFHFAQRGRDVTLNISIKLNPNVFRLADDEDHTDDPMIKREFRDARLGKELLQEANIETISISEIDSADDASTFTIVGTLGTKIPGTGYGFKELEKHDFTL